jgi:hypothetical protein
LRHEPSPKCRRILNGLGVLNVCDRNQSYTWNIGMALYQSRIYIEALVLVEVDESVKQSWSCRVVVYNEAAEELALRKCTEVKSSNYTKVVGATLQCTEEVRIACCVRIDNVPIGENDFEVGDIVASKTFAGREIGKTTCVSYQN